MKILHYVILSFVIAAITACSSSDNIILEGKCGECLEAVIRNFGDPALDGCGYVVDVNSQIFMPKNLPSVYKVEDLQVELKYEVQDSTRCGMIQFYPAILIKEIRKKD